MEKLNIMFNSKKDSFAIVFVWDHKWSNAREIPHEDEHI